jgi:hypothetical protein
LQATASIADNAENNIISLFILSSFFQMVSATLAAETVTTNFNE